MVIIFLTLLPIWVFGFFLTRILSSEKRIEVILPISFLGSITLFVFFLNCLSYFFHPPVAIFIIYILFILLGIILFFYKGNKKIIIKKLDFPKGKALFFILLSTMVWGIFLFNVIGHMSLSGDPTLYEIIGRTYSRGNFPVYEPWQPDNLFSYHYGPSILFGMVHAISQKSFDLIHRFTAFLTILLLSQFLIWVTKRHNNLSSLLIYQIIPLITLVSLGNIMIALLLFPLQSTFEFTGLLRWLSNFPTVSQAFGTYGGAITSLGGLVFWVHNLFGLASFIWIIWLNFMYKKEYRIFSWSILALSFAAIALINEIFLPPAICVSIIVFLFRERPLSERNKALLMAMILISGFIILFQGGVATQTVFGKKSEYKSAYFLPNKKNIFVVNINGKVVTAEQFDKEQQASLLLPQQKQWLPFRWYHPGFLIFYIVNIFICLILYRSRQRKIFILSFSLFCAACLTTLIYDTTYILFNGSRLIALTYTFLGINIGLAITLLLDYLLEKKRFLYFLFFGFFSLWILAPSLLPSLAYLLHNQEQLNLFISQESTTLSQPLLEWMKKNLPYNARVVNVMTDANYLMYTFTKVGIFTPTFNPKYRAYSSGGSPEYVDMFYTLNPSTIKLFKINYLVIDSLSLAKLPLIRQKQIESSQYFIPIYTTKVSLYAGNKWERIYKITDKYMLEAKDLPGTFAELNQKIIPQNATVYIDNEFPPGDYNVHFWEFLRRPVIFSLKERDLYYEKALASGNHPYVHVEAYVRGRLPSKDTKYDYLILAKPTNPESICRCKTELVWKSFEDNIKVWKIIQ